MLEFICAIGVIILGIAFIGLLVLMAFYFNKLFNHLLYLEKLQLRPFEDVSTEISFEGLDDYVKED